MRVLRTRPPDRGELAVGSGSGALRRCLPEAKAVEEGVGVVAQPAAGRQLLELLGVASAEDDVFRKEVGDQRLELETVLNGVSGRTLVLGHQRSVETGDKDLPCTGVSLAPSGDPPEAHPFTAARECPGQGVVAPVLPLVALSGGCSQPPPSAR